ncbi:hypothetical protein BH20VER3_BH20VER3_13070 [soil metagenome]
MRPDSLRDVDVSLWESICLASGLASNVWDERAGCSALVLLLVTVIVIDLDCLSTKTIRSRSRSV